MTPDEPQYAAVLRGENVPPEPVNAQPRKVEAAVTAPAWATPGACGRQPGAVDRPGIARSGRHAGAGGSTRVLGDTGLAQGLIGA